METPIEIESSPTVTKLYNFDGSLLALLGPAAVSMLDAKEIKRAVNEYDDLIKQRDALAAACRLFTRAYYGNGGTDVNWELYDRAALDALAALALVKGDQKSDDATT